MAGDWGIAFLRPEKLPMYGMLLDINPIFGLISTAERCSYREAIIKKL